MKLIITLRITLMINLFTNIAPAQIDVLKLCMTNPLPLAAYPFTRSDGATSAIHKCGENADASTQVAFAYHLGREGARFFGEDTSYVEIPKDDCLDTVHSITILAHIYPTGEAGPILNYNPVGPGVRVWQSPGSRPGKSKLTAWFTKRSLESTEALSAEVIDIGKWNFIGASYNEKTKIGRLFKDGKEVASKKLGSFLLATQFSIRLGSMPTLYGFYDGYISCLQIYNESLSEMQVTERMDACDRVKIFDSLETRIWKLDGLSYEGNVQLDVFESFELRMDAVSSTFVQLRVDYGDGNSTFISTTDRISTYQYSEKGDYTITISFPNLCFTIAQSLRVTVKIPEYDLSRTKVEIGPSAINETTKMKIVFERITRFICSIDFGIGAQTEIVSNLVDVVFSASHVYSSPGRYPIIVTCNNAISRFKTNATAIVQEPISEVIVEEIGPQITSSDISVQWQIDFGTDLNISTYFNGIFTGSFFLKTAGKGQVKVDPCLVEKQEGLYKFEVEAKNEVSEPIKSSQMIKLYKPVPHLHIATSSQIVEVDKIFVIKIHCSILASVECSPNITFTLNTDEMKSPVYTKQTQISYSFRTHGIHTINITASNPVSTKLIQFKVVAKRKEVPIQNISGDIKINTGRSNATVFFSVYPVTEMDCRVMVANGNKTELVHEERIPHGYHGDQYFNRSFPYAVQRDTSYELTVFCFNSISTVLDTKTLLYTQFQEYNFTALIESGGSDQSNDLDISLVFPSDVMNVSVPERGQRDNLVFDKSSSATINVMWKHYSKENELYPNSTNITHLESNLVFQFQKKDSAEIDIRNLPVKSHEPIKDLIVKLVTPIDKLFAGENTVFDIGHIHGTGVLYMLHFGEAESFRITRASRIKHVFRIIGHRQVTIIGYNSVNQIRKTLTLFIRKPMHKINELGINAAVRNVTDNLAFLDINMEEGSAFKCLIDFGDGTESKQVEHFDQDNSLNMITKNTLSFQITHRFTIIKPYTVTAKCWNEANTVLTSNKMIIQNPIRGLKIQPIKYLQSNTVFNLTWSLQTGNNVTYIVEYGLQRHVFNNTSFKRFHVELNSSKAGENTVNLTSFNMVSCTNKKQLKIHVEDMIEELHVKLLPNISTYEVNQSVLAQFGVQDNLTANYTVQFLSQTWKFYQPSTVLLKMPDKIPNGLELMSLEFIVNATNNISFVTNRLTLVVLKPIIPVGKLQLSTSPNGVKENSTLKANLTKGSSFICLWKFGDNSISQQDFTSNRQDSEDRESNEPITFTEFHHYNKTGDYLCELTCWNRLSRSSATVLVFIRDYITDIFIREIPTQLVNQDFEITWGVHHVTWRFNYSVSLGKIVIESGSVLNSFAEQITKISGFYVEEAGFNNLSIRVWNLISEETKNYSFKVQKSVGEFYIQVVYENSTNGKEEVVQGNTVSLLHLVCLRTIFDEEQDAIRYKWNIISSRIMYNSENSSFCLKFDYLGEYAVDVEVYNDVSNKTANKKINLSLPPPDVTLTSFTNDTGMTLMNLSLSHFDPEACFEIQCDEMVEIYNLGNDLSACLEKENKLSFDHFLQVDHNNIDFNFDYFFPRHGSYQCVVRSHNNLIMRKLEFEIEVPPSCFHPLLRIKNYATNITTPSQRYRSQEIRIFTDLNIACAYPISVNFTWTVSKCPMNSTEFIPVEFADSIAQPSGFLNERELLVQPRTLNYNLYQFDLRIDVNIGNDTDRYITATAYINVTISPLDAEIKGGSFIRRGYGGILVKDGCLSRDPDVDPQNPQGLTFQWHCFDWSDVIPNSLASGLSLATEYVRAISNGSASNNSVGCYGNGVVRIGGNSPTISLDSTIMKLESFYIVILVVYKGSRSSTAYQVMNIVELEPPLISINCEENCHGEISPSTQLALTSDCAGTGCHGTLNYQWEVLQRTGFLNDGSAVWTDDDHAMEESKFYSKTSTLVISKNVLRTGAVYRFRLYAWIDENLKGFAQVDAKTNEAPYGGTCETIPKIGNSEDTAFKITCEGWKDAQDSLFYQFYYVIDGKETLLSYGMESSIVTKLPPGRIEAGNLIHVKMQIINVRNTAATEIVKVLVYDPPKIDSSLQDSLALSVLGDRTSLDTELMLGDYQSAMRQMDHLSSMLNLISQDQGNETEAIIRLCETIELKSNSTNVTADCNNTEIIDGVKMENKRKQIERQEIRARIIDSVSKTPVSSLDAIRQSSQLVEKLTIVQGEFQYNSQALATKSMKNGISLLSSKTNDAVVSTDLIRDTARDILGALSNIVYTTAKKTENKAMPIPKDRDFEYLFGSTIVKRNQNEDAQTKQAKQLVRNVVDSTIDVATSVSERNVKGERTTALDESHIEILAATFSAEQDKPVIGQGDITVEVDDIKEIIQTSNADNEPINIQMVVFPDNPFDWDRHEKMSTLVSSVTVSQKSHKLPVNNLKKPIKMSFPHRIDANSSHFVWNPSQWKWNYHRIEVDALIGITVLIKPENKHDNLSIYIGDGAPPNSINYFSKDVIPRRNLSCDDCDAKYSVFAWNGLHQRRVYYVGVTHLIPTDTELNRTDELLVNNSLNVNYTILMLTTGCNYFNLEESQWKKDGCQVLPETNTTMLHCQCNHLTSFAGQIVVAPNPIDFGKAFRGFLTAFQTGNIAVLFTYIFIYTLYIVLVLIFRRKDLRHSAQLTARHVPNINRPSSEYRYLLTFFTGRGAQCGSTANVSVNLTGSHASTGPYTLLSSESAPFKAGSVKPFVLAVPETLGPLAKMRVWHDNFGLNPSWYLSRVTVYDCQTEETWIFLCNRWLAIEEEDGSIDFTFSPAGEEELAKTATVFKEKFTEDIFDKHLWISMFLRSPQSRFTHVQRLTCCLSVLCGAMMANAMFYGIAQSVDEKENNALHIGPLVISLTTISIAIQCSLIVLPANLILVMLFRYTRSRDDVIKLGRRAAKRNLAKKKNGKEIRTPNMSRPRSSASTDDVSIQIDDNDDKHSATTEERNEDNVYDTLDTPTAKSYANFGTEIDDEIWDDNLSTKQMIRMKNLSGGNPTNEMEEDYYWDEDVTTKVQVKRRKDKKEQLQRVYGLFPSWVAYITWTCCFLICITTTFITILYSMSWGRQKSNAWLLHVGIYLIQDVIFAQPIKLMLVSFAIAFLFKKSVQKERLDHVMGTTYNVVSMKNLFGNNANEPLDPVKVRRRFRPINDKGLELAREQGIKQRQLNETLRDFCYSLILLSLVLIVIYGHKADDALTIRNQLNHLLAGENLSLLKNVTNFQSLWFWTQHVLIPGIYGFSHGSQHDFTQQSRVLGENILLGASRIRQVRVKNDSCHIIDEFDDVIERCHKPYSKRNEDKTSYGPSWIPLDPTAHADSLNDVINPWKYEASVFHEIPYLWPIFHLYQRGGYAVEISPSKADEEYANNLVEYLKDYDWLDSRTRAVFFEFSLYNVNRNLLSVCVFTFEFPEIGGAFATYELYINRFYEKMSTGYVSTLVFDIIFYLFIFYSIYCECQKLFTMRIRYFYQYSNVANFIFTLVGLSALCVYIARLYVLDLKMEKFKLHPDDFQSFYKTAIFNEMIGYLLALILFLCIMKFAVFLKLNTYMYKAGLTMAYCARHVAGIVLLVVLCILAHAFPAWIVLCSSSLSYQDLYAAITALVIANFGYRDLSLDRDYLPFLIKWLYVSFWFTVKLILTFLVIVVLTDAYRIHGAKDALIDYKVIDHVMKRFKLIIGVEKPPKLEVDELIRDQDPQMDLMRSEKRMKKLQNKIDANNKLLSENVNSLYVEDFSEDLSLTFAFLTRRIDCYAKVNPNWQKVAVANMLRKEGSHQDEDRQQWWSSEQNYMFHKDNK